MHSPLIQAISRFFAQSVGTQTGSRPLDGSLFRSGVLLRLQIVVELGVQDIGDEHVAGAVGGLAFSTAAWGVTPQGQNTGISPG